MSRGSAASHWALEASNGPTLFSTQKGAHKSVGVPLRSILSDRRNEHLQKCYVRVIAILNR